MKELNDGFYCSAGYWKDGDCRGVRKNSSTFSYGSSAYDKDCAGQHCRNYRHKHPTLEQFKQEYDIEIKENTPVYIFNPIKGDWELCEYWRVNQIKNDLDRLNKDMGRKLCDNTPLYIICCTPFNKPDKDWRPK